MKYAICNETFGELEHGRACEAAAQAGYTGLEVAPFTLAPRITDVSQARLAETRRAAEAHGLQIIGLHWLLAKTEGLHVTSADADARRATGDYLAALARASRELGGDVLVLGSPDQRRVPAGATPQQAEDYAVETIGHCLKALEETGVFLCLEPLAPREADFWTTAAEADSTIERVGHPNVKLHLDVKAMSSEPRPVGDTIRRHRQHLKHFHANDPNLRGPGFGDVDFKPIFAALAEVGYDGWVSVEVFDYTPDADTIARESIRYMRECAA